MFKQTIAAAVAAGTLILAAAGLAVADPAPVASCSAQLVVLGQVQALAKDSKGPGTVRDGTVITAREQASIEAAIAEAHDPKGPGGADEAGQEQARIKAAQAAAVDSKGPGQRHDGTKVTKEEYGLIVNAQVSADAACKGADGKPGESGKDAATVITTVRPAPVPHVVTSGELPTVTH